MTERGLQSEQNWVESFGFLPEVRVHRGTLEGQFLNALSYINHDRCIKPVRLPSTFRFRMLAIEEEDLPRGSVKDKFSLGSEQRAVIYEASQDSNTGEQMYRKLFSAQYEWAGNRNSDHWERHEAPLRFFTSDNSEITDAAQVEIARRITDRVTAKPARLQRKKAIKFLLSPAPRKFFGKKI